MQRDRARGFKVIQQVFVVYLHFDVLCGGERVWSMKSTKYDWSNVPVQVNWIATDHGDIELHFTEKPYIAHDIFWCVSHEAFLVAMHSPSQFKGNWKDSLEQRPKEQSQ